jgi:succinate-semialdehyde dehydrogenase/glutarate-semialdehyde dehydrogenase
MTRDLKLLIGGEWVPAASGETFDITNPATGEKVGTAASASAEDAARTVEAAHAAFRWWRKTPPPERGAILKRAARLAHEQVDELAELLTLEQGKPIGEARSEVTGSADALAFFGEEGWRIHGETMATSKPNRHSHVIKQPLGVVVAISPWYYPILLMAWWKPASRRASSMS